VILHQQEYRQLGKVNAGEVNVSFSSVSMHERNDSFSYYFCSYFATFAYFFHTDIQYKEFARINKVTETTR